jgi:hypothetical protein
MFEARWKLQLLNVCQNVGSNENCIALQSLPPPLCEPIIITTFLKFMLATISLLICYIKHHVESSFHLKLFRNLRATLQDIIACHVNEMLTKTFPKILQMLSTTLAHSLSKNNYSNFTLMHKSFCFGQRQQAAH